MWVPEDQAMSSVTYIHYFWSPTLTWVKKKLISFLKPMWFWVFCHLQLMQTLTNSKIKQKILWGFGIYWLWFVYLFVFTYKHLKWTLFSLSKRGNLLEGCWRCLRESKEMLNNQDKKPKAVWYLKICHGLSAWRAATNVTQLLQLHFLQESIPNVKFLLERIWVGQLAPGSSVFAGGGSQHIQGHWSPQDSYSHGHIVYQTVTPRGMV